MTLVLNYKKTPPHLFTPRDITSFFSKLSWQMALFNNNKINNQFKINLIKIQNKQNIFKMFISNFQLRILYKNDKQN